MSGNHPNPSLKPRYQGKIWVPVKLPNSVRDWSHGGEKSIVTDGRSIARVAEALSDLNEAQAWQWPKRRHYFLSDMHGDAAAFAASLVASGGVKKTGPKPRNFQLSEPGRRAKFIIGGDCFDKGPSSLDLLRTVRHLTKLGPRTDSRRQP